MWQNVIFCSCSNQKYDNLLLVVAFRRLRYAGFEFAVCRVAGSFLYMKQCVSCTWNKVFLLMKQSVSCT